MAEQTTPAQPAPMSGGSDVEKNKGLAALSYLWILSLVMLLVKKDSPFVQFHAKQAFILFIASVILGFIPVIGWLLNIVIMVLAIVGIVTALQGKWWKIPGISSLAEKIHF
jgi:uncharacterized membrane protein